MNLFLLYKDIPDCVAALVDKHVIKMILETAQILYSVWHTFAVLVLRHLGDPPQRVSRSRPEGPNS